MAGVTNPALQGQIIGAEGTYRPQYSGLNQRDIQNTLLGMGGGDGYFGLLDLQDMAARRTQGLAQDLQGNQNAFDLSRIAQFGPSASNAYFQINPRFEQALNAASGAANVGSPAFAQLGSQFAGGPTTSGLSNAPVNTPSVGFNAIQLGGQLNAPQVTAERIAAERIGAGTVAAQDVTGGALGNALYQQALQAQQQSPLSAALGQQALGMATTPGQLTPAEIRAATQGSREGYAASGRINDNASIAGEALARAGAARERQMQDLAAAQGINQQLLGASQAGQALATDVLRTDIARQQGNVGTNLAAQQFNVSSALDAARANQGTGLQASLANQSTGLQSQLANQQAAMDAQRFNITNAQGVQAQNAQFGLQAGTTNAANSLAAQGMNLGASQSNRDFNAQQAQQYFNNLYNYGLLGQQQGQQNFANQMALANMQQGVTQNALGLLGTQPSGMAYGNQILGAGMQQAGVQGPALFDPNAGINLALQNNANQSNYLASIYGSQAGVAGANAQARGQVVGGALQAIGNIFGGRG